MPKKNLMLSKLCKKTLRILLLLCFLPMNLVASGKSPSEIYPNRMITPDFGIVTVDDLAFDDTQMFSEPYDPKKDLSARYWQCQPIKYITPKYHKWRGEDGMGFSGREIQMCTLEIHMHLSSGLQLYGDRRGHPYSFCKEFEQNWHRLTQGEEWVCFSGEAPSNHVDEVLGKYRSWVWNKFKTRKGCYSYFGDCNVQHCAKGKCPQ